MNSPSRGSVTTWLDGLKDRSEGAAQELWNRYFSQLVQVARRQMRAPSREADEEDVALSALKSAMLGVQNNRFPDLNDRTGLWPLLVTITSRKAVNELKRQHAKKRDHSSELPLIEEHLIAGREPSPDFALRLAEEIQALVDALGDETLQVIAQRKLEGYANDEIAKELNVSTRTIVRKLARIRQEWDEKGFENHRQFATGPLPTRIAKQIQLKFRYGLPAARSCRLTQLLAAPITKRIGLDSHRLFPATLDISSIVGAFWQLTQGGRRPRTHPTGSNAMYKRVLLAVLISPFCLSSSVTARDYLLTIGGGYSPEGNQASLEKNVLFFQRLLNEQKFAPQLHTIYFADGQATGKDLQVRDVDAIPKANRLMAEFFGTERDLGMGYRNHEVPGVRESTNPGNIRRWFREIGSTMQRGDRLVLYVTAHGEESDDRDNPYNTAISLWDNQRLKVTDVVELLDQLPDGINVVAVMVQCYTGGFARFIYNGADPDKGLSRQQRCGFFATVHDRVAAGCTPEVDEASYVEYSTYFWEALGGRTRTGQSIAPPDYDKDGRVSFDEAHAYTVLKADTIDLPVKTSGEFLSVESQFADDEHPQLLPENAPYDVVRALSAPAERAVLDSLSEQLDLEGNGRIETAQDESQAPRRGSRRRQRGRSSGQRAARLRDTIADDLEERWPELSNVLNPGAIEFLTTRSQEFVQAVEQHPNYRQYRDQMEIEERRPDPQKRRVKYERFVRTAEDVILRENLKRLGDSKRIAQYEAIVAAESTSLRKAEPSTLQATRP